MENIILNKKTVDFISYYEDRNKLLIYLGDGLIHYV